MLGPVEVVAVQPFFPPKVQRLISDSEADLMINVIDWQAVHIQAANPRRT